VNYADWGPRVGIGYDLHRLVPGRPLFIGTVQVPYTFGLFGHSDADVLCHAIADALLGAAALGEIGVHFPDSDPQWKGVSGGVILDRVVALLAGRGFRVANIDAIVVAERPRLAAHHDAMVAGLAQALGIDPARVSVKIKSNEGCDATGRGEAIAAHAIAMIEAV
jgi:2-C-methyl-D-erythritol 2,4-cyclodiphosphate synthase